MDTQRRRGAGRVAFLAHREKLQGLLAGGHTIRAMYDDHAADFGISYWQFGRYVRQYLQPPSAVNKRAAAPEIGSILSTPAAAPKAPPPQETLAPSPAQTAQGETHSKSQTKGGFQHDPNSGNVRDDLI